MCGPVTRPDHLGLDPEVAERLEQRPRHLLLAGGVGLGGLAGRAGQEPRRRAPASTNSGSSVIAAAVAALRGEVRPGRSRAGSRPVLRARRRVGAGRPRAARRRASSGVVSSRGPRARRSAAPRRASRGRRARRSRARAGAAARARSAAIGRDGRQPLSARLAAAPGPPPSPDGGPPRCEVAGRSGRRPVPATPAPVARMTPASVAPVTRITPGEQQEHGEDAARRRARSGATLTHSSAWPSDAAARLEASRVPEVSARGAGPGRARASPAASASVSAAVRQISAGAHRARRRAQLAQQDQRAAERPAPPGPRSRARRTRTGRP